MTWIVIGFLCLIKELFPIGDSVWNVLGLLLVILVSPAVNSRAHWLRRALEFVGGMCALVVAVIAIVWLSEKTGLNAGLALSVIALFIGIILQVWGEWFGQSQTTQEAFRPLIEKIKNL